MVIVAVIMMLVLGAVLGLGLGVADKYLKVEADVRVEKVTSLLPGYNCGACGYPGCAGLAEALVNGEAKSPTQCKPSTEAHRTRITTFMETGVDPQAETAHAH